MSNRSSFQIPTPRPDGKYNHPWIQSLPAGRAKVYNVLHKTVTAGLILFAVYGGVEVVRGSYYILQSAGKPVVKKVRHLGLD